MATFWSLAVAVVAAAAAECGGGSCPQNVTRDHLLLQRKVASVVKAGHGGHDGHDSNATGKMFSITGSTGQCDKEFVNLGPRW